MVDSQYDEKIHDELSRVISEHSSIFVRRVATSVELAQKLKAIYGKQVAAYIGTEAELRDH